MRADFLSYPIESLLGSDHARHDAKSECPAELDESPYVAGVRLSPSLVRCQFEAQDQSDLPRRFPRVVVKRRGLDGELAIAKKRGRAAFADGLPQKHELGLDLAHTRCFNASSSDGLTRLQIQPTVPSA